MSTFAAELRLFLSSRANSVLVLLLFALAAGGAANGVVRVRNAHDAALAGAQADVQSWAEKRALIAEYERGRKTADQASAARKAHRAVLSNAAARWTEPPVAELGVLSASSVRPTPDDLPVGVASRYRGEDPSLDDPTSRLDGSFDISFVATWLAPLAALLLGFDVLSRDRELRVAPLLVAQGGSLLHLATTRCLVRILALFLAVALPAIVAALIAPDQTTAAIAIWLGGYLLLLLFWFGLSAAVNATARTTTGATLSLVLGWIVFALLSPALLSVALARIAPAPDRMAGILQLRTLETRLTRDRASVTSAFYAADPQRRPIATGDEYENYFVGEYYPRQRAFIEAFAPVAKRMDERRVAQARTLRVGSLIAPGLALKLLSDDLSGGSPERRVAYLKTVDGFQQAWLAHFDRKLASMRPLDSADYTSAPAFAPAPEPMRDRWPRVALLMAILGLPAGASWIWARRQLLRATPL